MFWAIAGIVMVLIGLLGAVILIGLMIPVAHSATSRVRVAAPPDEVWSVLTDFERHAEWRTGLDSSQRADPIDGKEVWVERSRFGPLPLTIEQRESPTLLVMRIADDRLPFGGTWTYRLAPSDGATVVSITEDGFISNPIFRFMSRFLMGYHGNMDRLLKDLSKKFGSPAQPEHVRPEA